MGVYKTIKKRRTVRRFKQRPIPFVTLKRLVNAARLAPSAGNLQPCEYIVVDHKEIGNEVFNTLRWAAYISPKGIPPMERRPVAYIVVVLNIQKAKRPNVRDAAASIENMILLAQEQGIGSCWLGSIDRRRLRKILGIPRYCIIDSVLALGYPAEAPRLEEMKDSVKYWKDRWGILHVPKRSLEEILHRETYKPKGERQKGVTV